ncbi:MAG: ribokinase [Saprospiraceae bacterium]
MNLFVVGSSNMDLVISLPRIPLAGETILGGKSSMIFGGKGANQAVAASRCGLQVGFITKLGKDIFGDNIKAHFNNEGLAGQFILTDEHEPTGIAQIFVSEQGENVIAVAPGANAQLTINDIIPFEPMLQQAKVILIQLEIPIETVSYVVNFASKNKIKVILNPAPARILDDELLNQVWLLTPNESEAGILAGIEVHDMESAEKAGEILLQKGIQNVIITLGENGCLLCNQQGSKHYPAFKLKAIDSTAAGDVFNGALAVAITNQLSWNMAIPFANAAAAISVTRYGAQTSIPYKVEVDNFLHSG